MTNCIRCGGSFLLHGKVQLKDAVVCRKCFKTLGFDKRDLLTASVYEYENIKNGRDQYYKDRIAENAASAVSVQMVGGGYGKEQIINEQEREIFDIIRSLCDDDNLDSEVLELIRKADEYVSIVMVSSDGNNIDFARIKYTPRTKWIQFAPDFERIELNTVEDVTKHINMIRSAYRFNQPYL